MSTQSQINANRANAQLSTGPTSADGKTRSSLNAVKTGLTGRTVVLPTEDASAYQAHLDRFFSEWAPADDLEKDLVQDLADTEWRLLRIPAIESGIFALGQREFAPEFANEEESVRASMIQTRIFLAYGRQLSNLSIQENRLRRHRDRVLESLVESQKQRTSHSSGELCRAARLLTEARRDQQPFNPAAFGFEFSHEQIEERARLFQLPTHARPTCKLTTAQRYSTLLKNKAA